MPPARLANIAPFITLPIWGFSDRKEKRGETTLNNLRVALSPQFTD